MKPSIHKTTSQIEQWKMPWWDLAKKETVLFGRAENLKMMTAVHRSTNYLFYGVTCREASCLLAMCILNACQSARYLKSSIRPR
jgi:hypothetical protein